MEDVFIKYISTILYYFISFEDVTSIQKANFMIIVVILVTSLWIEYRRKSEKFQIYRRK